MKSKTITIERFLTAVNGHEGWCTECKQFTHGMAEPDAENYKCPVCEQLTVMGAELAQFKGIFTFSG